MAFGRKAWNVNAVSAAIYVSTVLTLESSLFKLKKTNKKFSSLKIAKNSGILFIIGTSGATNLPMAIAETTLKYGGTIVDINTEDNLFTERIKEKKNKIIIRETSTETLKTIREIVQHVIGK